MGRLVGYRCVVSERMPHVLKITEGPNTNLVNRWKSRSRRANMAAVNNGPRADDDLTRIWYRRPGNSRPSYHRICRL